MNLLLAKLREKYYIISTERLRFDVRNIFCPDVIPAIMLYSAKLFISGAVYFIFLSRPYV